jgi:hypothetical protein
MIFLPGSCLDCSQLTLVSGDRCLKGQMSCPDCGGPVALVAGSAYPAGDIPLFEELCEAIRESYLSGGAAQQLATAVHCATALGLDEIAFAEVESAVPALAPVRAILAAYPARQRQALSMLATILRVRAQSRTSGIVAIVDASDLDEVSSGQSMLDRKG